jgi:carbamoylphosphate synthase small subunit
MFNKYSMMMATTVLRKSGAGEISNVFSAKSLHEFLNEKDGDGVWSIYMVRKLLKHWREQGWVKRVANQYYFTQKATWELL